MKKVFAIAAMDEGRVIGSGSKIPWRIPEDLKRFSQLTKGHTVLMGKNTFFSIPEKYRPLPERLNVIASRSLSKDSVKELYNDNILTTNDAVEFVKKVLKGEITILGDILWIIGGEQIYKATIPFWQEVFLTVVRKRYEGDKFFPKFEDKFVLKEKEEYNEFCYLHYI